MNKRKCISVIIPTHNRLPQLLETLDCYKQQTIAQERFEIIISDDGSLPTVEHGLKDQTYPFSVHLLRQDKCGPAAARNLALKIAGGEILLFTGDDILPSPGLLEDHMRAHQNQKEKNTAILGMVEWASDPKPNSLMHHVTQIGGQQFAYFGLEDNSYVGARHFNTANVSIKEQFLTETKETFCEVFTEAGFEDIELAYRLERSHGLKTFLDKSIVAFHKHPMTLESFYRRQFRCGQMAALLDRLHPNYFSETGALKTKKCVRQDGFPIHEEIPKDLISYHEQLNHIQRDLGANPPEEAIIKKMESHFFNEVLFFAFSSGASSYNQKTPDARG